MANTLVQSKIGFFTTFPNSLAFDNPTVAGNLLIAMIGSAGAKVGTLTDNQSHSWLQAGIYQNGSVAQMSLWYVLASVGGAVSLTVQHLSPANVNRYTIILCEYSGTSSQATALVGVNGTGNVANSTPTPGAITCNPTNLVISGYGQSSQGQSAPSVSSPFTVRVSNNDGLTKAGLVLADATATGTSETPVFTMSGSTNWVSLGASFIVGSGTPVPSPAPTPVPVTPPTPSSTPAPEAGPQESQSGRVVTLVTVVGGNVYVAPASGSTWLAAANSTGRTLITTGIVRSAANQQKVYFADGVHYLYYDPAENEVFDWVATAGSLPVDLLGNTPRLICTWRGRTVVSGLINDPQNWFMSAVNDPTDWNYFPDPQTPTQAVAGNNSLLGLVGDVITTLIPYDDDTLIFGGDHTIWVLRGDPFSGGQIDRISDRIGMAWGIPWDRGPDGTLYFVSNQTGIYAMEPGAKPVRMSQQIEQHLVNINTGHTIIRVQWDDQEQGLHVYCTNADEIDATVHFFWEQRTGAWWTDTFADQGHNPLAVCTFDGNTPQDRRALIGSWDGYVRMHSRDAVDDDGTPIDTAVVLGPILTREFDEVLFKDIQAILGANSGEVDYSVHIGATAEIALSSEAVASGTWTAGRNFTTPVRRAGHAIWVKLSSRNYWAMEAIKLRIHGDMGKAQRRGA